MKSTPFSLLVKSLIIALPLLFYNFFSFSKEVTTIPGWDKMEAKVKTLMYEGDIPGLSLVLIDGKHTYIKSYGFKDVESTRSVTSKTLFELGSCSKAFTALATMHLVTTTNASLDDSVSKYIPWLTFRYNGKGVAVSIRQLLHHTSGIPWNTIAKIPETDASDALEQTVRRLQAQELNHIPGQEFEYATINYDVLALIIQTVAKQPFESYLQANILDPLDLRYTSIGSPKNRALMSEGHKIGFFTARQYQAPIYRGNNAAGYVISNAEDMAKWLQIQMGLYEKGNFHHLIRKTHQRDESVTLHGLSSYAAGWEVSLNGTGEIYHAGLNPNFTSHINFRPGPKLGVAVLANANSTYTSEIANVLMNYLAKKEETSNGSDPADNIDRTYSIFSIAVVLYSLIVIALLIHIIIGAIRGQRNFEAFNRHKIKSFLLALVNLAPFIFGLYILPRALAGFTWVAMLVWSPMSFEILLYSIAGAVALSYLTYLISLLYVEANEYKRIAPQVILFSILSGLANVVIIVMVTSSLQTAVELKYLTFYYLLILGIYLFGRRFVQVKLIRFARGLVFDLRVKMIEKIFSTSYQKFEKISRGRVYTVLNDDINTIGESTNIVMLLITSVITALGAFVYLASIAFWATALTVLLIIILAVVYAVVAQRTEQYFEKARDERTTFMQLVSGMVDGYKEISLRHNKKLQYKDDVSQSADRYRQKSSTADVSFVNAFLVAESLLVVLLGAVAFGMPEVFPTIKSYSLMSFVIVLLYLIGPINGILTSVPSIMNLRVSWNRIQQFLAEIPANLDLQKVTEPVIPHIKSFTMKGVKYEYENKNGERHFSIGPIDFEAKAGEIIFIVGGNGSGKTTLAKIITGLYEVQEGTIRINDKPQKNAALGEYFSAVFSPPYVFEKLYDINLIEKKDALLSYLKLLDLDQKVTIKGNRYSTVNLSTGQRKRLALLQCYLEDAPIFLFDEWAADQDPEYRVFFYNTLLPEMKRTGKIVLAITHDDHYFHLADRVLKMNNGKLEKYIAKDQPLKHELIK
ncbi:cyclic peptide export ABC transporter [Fulvivirga sp. M361]|uniref:cyclic peptide export ABC transporter n=1 Tax=Fulvivirga sp. M361 TaxID=2594266 RepID=UPI00117BDAAF|nr:cyclic peptide export ABC transporter [Fulvivirga sp. M361]TRX50036.1 cyclic peptide export ABC transporter [Fulvivirga sp. M361]